MNTCDIIIPTYNGKEKLQRTLDALLVQAIPASWTVRVIISDDGSTPDELYASVDSVWRRPWIPPVVVKNDHGGRSHARNAAIAVSSADIVLFLADDILLRPGALAEHLLFHEENPEPKKGALGGILWDPRIRPTPFMDWMMHGGQQNDYDSILGVATCDPAHYFYGSFVSLKRSFLGNDRFLEEFSSYGWEDLELGARLGARGLVLHVLHNARALHAHRYPASSLLQRQRIVGSAKYLVNTNSIRRAVHGIYGLFALRGLIRLFLIKRGDKANIPRLFMLATAGEFWYGVHHANRLLIREKK